MRRIKFTLAIIIAVLSISFTTFNYTETEEFNPAFFIAENQWELQKTVWSESSETFESDQDLSFQFNINQIYKLKDTRGKQYAGTWSIRKNAEGEYVLILDEGKVIEEKYRIVSISNETNELALEKLNSLSGNLNLTYIFKSI